MFALAQRFPLLAGALLIYLPLTVVILLVFGGQSEGAPFTCALGDPCSHWARARDL